MSKPIQVRMLTEHEVAKLVHTAKFNVLRPTSCKQCGNTSNFRRKVFWIGGVSKTKQSSDSTQSLIAHHLKARHGVESVFFKTNRNALYGDSAECQQCGSTVIEFDIELSDVLLASVANCIGKPIEELRHELEGLVKDIAENKRNPPASQ